MMKGRCTSVEVLLDNGQMCRLVGGGVLNIEQTVIDKNGRDVPYVYAVVTVTPEEISYGPAQPKAVAQSDDLPGVQSEQAPAVRESSPIPGSLGGGSL